MNRFQEFERQIREEKNQIKELTEALHAKKEELKQGQLRISELESSVRKLLMPGTHVSLEEQIAVRNRIGELETLVTRAADALALSHSQFDENCGICSLIRDLRGVL